MDNSKHMVSDPNARELTEGGKNAGGSPPQPVVLYLRGNDVLNSKRETIAESLPAALAHLRSTGTDPFTHVSVYVDGHMVRIADGRLKDLG